MSEQNQNQEGQKTIVAFVVGLLIGGLIVWMFSSSPSDAPVNGIDENGVDTEEVIDTDNDTGSVSEDNGASEAPTNNEAEAPSTPPLVTGEGAVSVSNQPAASRVALDSVTYPMSEGWIGVRDYNNDHLGGLLGVVRFSERDGLVPEDIILQRSTEPGREYAVVFYTAGPTNNFNLSANQQVDGIFATFTAQ